MGRAGLGLDGGMTGRRTFKHWSELGLGGGTTWMKEAKSSATERESVVIGLLVVDRVAVLTERERWLDVWGILNWCKVE
jgi:hypothetical protein